MSAPHSPTHRSTAHPPRAPPEAPVASIGVPVTILHTSDWHVGKAIRGASRAEEHRAVLAEIATIAASDDVDVVLVAGDLFDSATPSPESEQIVYEALLALARTGATVAVTAGNHDNARGLRAVAPLLALGNVHLVAEPRRPDDGGLLALTTREGTAVRIAMLPFVSKRGIVRASDLMDAEAFENAQRYSDRLRLLIDALCAPFRDDAVNVLMAHTFVLGAVPGGGERPAHLVDEYAVTAASFPPSIGYGALGHLHRAQRVPAGAALHYCGSPLQLDFGEGDHPQQVNVVTAAPGVPADVRAARLTAGRRLRTVRGSIDDLAALDIADDPWLRVVVRGERHAGLADDVRRLLGPRVVDVRVDVPDEGRRAIRRDHRGHSPQELFGDFLRAQGIADDRIESLFTELLDEALEVPPA
jgi:DNA repair protein SbcD/Mre11